jgi:hypothetical protein
MLLIVLALFVAVVLCLIMSSRREELAYIAMYDTHNHIANNPWAYPVPYSATTARFQLERDMLHGGEKIARF